MALVFGFLTLRNASGFDSCFLVSGVVKALAIKEGCFVFAFGVAFCLESLGSTILLDIEEIRASLDTLDFEGFAGTVRGHFASELLHRNSCKWC